MAFRREPHLHSASHHGLKLYDDFTKNKPSCGGASAPNSRLKQRSIQTIESAFPFYTRGPGACQVLFPGLYPAMKTAMECSYSVAVEHHAAYPSSGIQLSHQDVIIRFCDTKLCLAAQEKMKFPPPDTGNGQHSRLQDTQRLCTGGYSLSSH